VACVGVLALLLIARCKEGMKVIYLERIALLPDASGLLEKEVRADEKGNQFVAILESQNGKIRELAILPMEAGQDVKFRSGFHGDTVLLFHDVPKLQDRIGSSTFAASRFPIRIVLLDPAKWLATGTEEGNGIFYAPDKWKAYLEMTTRK
jgi:hypothetical protein